MRVPSLSVLLAASLRTYARFPLVITAAVAGTAAALLLIDHEGPEKPTVLWSILLGSALAIPLFTAATLVSERNRRLGGIAAFFTAGALAIGYALTVPADLPDAPEFHTQRFFILVAGLFAMATVAAHTGLGEAASCWHFMKFIALRLIFASLFASVLFCGFALALAALDNLFGVNVPGKRYGELWVLIVGIFYPWFTLDGVPENTGDPDPARTYPKIVKIFGQYILLPIVIVYLVILTAFAAKIAVEWVWPDGWVSRLILSYGATGLLMTILVFPLRDAADNPWARRASRIFHVTMIPFTVILFLALWRRISEYGVTEGRYLAVILGFWFAAMSLYFLLSRAGDVRVVPASILLLALVTAYGPWSAFAISESSQAGRLRALLEKNSMFSGGSVVRAAGATPADDRGEMGEALLYLGRVHGYGSIEEWFSESLRDSGDRFITAEAVGLLMGFEIRRPWSDPEGLVSLQRSDSTAVSTKGYEFLVRAGRLDGNTVTGNAPGWGSYPDAGFQWQAGAAADSITIRTTSGARDSLVIPLRGFFGNLLAEHPGFRADLPAEKLSLASENGRMRVKLLFSSIRMTRSGESFSDLGYDLQILYSAK